MGKFLQILMLIFTVGFAGTSAAAEYGTPEEAVAMVRKAIAYMKANGKEKTIAEANNPKGQFIDRDLYVTMADMNAKMLANGANPRLVGKDLIDLKDADGRYFMRDRLEALKTKNSGWADYKWLNPLTKNLDLKSGYFEKYEDVIFSCGVYKK
jgi:cytochrome c